jgi:hypothetical protein
VDKPEELGGGQHATFGILFFISIFAGSRTLARECVLEHSILSDRSSHSIRFSLAILPTV